MLYSGGLYTGGDYGEGYRYPSLANAPVVEVTYKNSKGNVIHREVRKPDNAWAAAYILNKKTAASNPWVKFMKGKMDKLRQEYYEQMGYKADEIPTRKERVRHKLEVAALGDELAQLSNLPDDQLIKLYYENRPKALRQAIRRAERAAAKK